MRFQTCLLALASVASLATVAQPSASLDGDWVAKFNAANGTPREAKVVIHADAGTWKSYARVRGDPCVGLEMPVLVSKVQPDGFEFGVTRSKALAGCKDSVAQMKRVDGKSFEGTWDDGRKILLTRQ